MVRISIISLIYQSPKLADWVYNSVLKYTPMVTRGEAEFFFVANDPTPALLDHLRAHRYDFVVNINKRYTNDELFALGYATPEYMSRVYRGYNVGIRHSKADYVVLINSDNYLSPDWLENLLKYSDRARVMSSTLVERHHPTFSVFPGALHGEFGGTAETFDEEGFLAFAARVKKTGIELGGAYMPTLFHRDIAIEAGLYPTGNIAGANFEEVSRYGDEAFFDTLATLGVVHYTALDSISYHLKEGERADAPARDSNEIQPPSVTNVATWTSTPALAYPIKPAISRVVDSMPADIRHDALMQLVVANTVDSPAIRTLRQLVASGLLGAQREQEAKDAIEAASLEAQGRALRSAVQRIVGERFADSVMRAIHSVAWIVRPIRVAIARRRVPRVRM
jgi:hypothetical protein